MNKAYYRINGGKGWKNFPNEETPLNEQNLNKQDIALDEIDNRVIAMNTTKLDKVDAQTLVRSIDYNRDNGVFTITYFNGATATIDTMLEKLMINFDFDSATQQLIIALDDGTERYVDLSALITQYEFADSDTITFILREDGKVSAKIKAGSIREEHLRPDYLADVKLEVSKAQASATAADSSEKNAAKSAQDAAASENTVKADSEFAASSAAAAAKDAATATEKAANAGKSATAAKNSEDNAQSHKVDAKRSADSAADSRDAASILATNAAVSESKATQKATEADNYAKMSKSYAIGTRGEVREGDDADCSKYYYEQVKKISQGFSGLIPMGTISFTDLNNPDNQQSGYLFNISDSFTSDDRFQDGGGIFYGAGNNLIYTADRKWDVLAAAMVSGVKGSAETEYRQGFVNITKENIGLGSVGNFKAVSAKASQGLSNEEKTNARNNISALATDGDSKDNTITFASGDMINPSGWTDVDLIASGERHNDLWSKVSLFAKNVRYLWKLLGSTSLTGIGDGTVTGAISALNTGLDWKYVGYVTGTDRLSLPFHKEVWVSVDFQSDASFRRAMIIPNIDAFETDLYGQIGGVTDCVHIYYHQSVVGMYPKNDNGGTENLKLSAWYR